MIIVDVAFTRNELDFENHKLQKYDELVSILQKLDIKNNDTTI